MATITFKGLPVQTQGELPAVGSMAPAFQLTGQDLRPLSLDDFAGKRKLLNIFPSIDTPTCSTSVRKFNQHAATLADTVVICVSADLPFAHRRFCGAEGIDNVVTGSLFRASGFAEGYGVIMTGGALAGLCARSVVVLDADNRVLHTEMVGEIGDEPNYDAALAALG